MVFILYLFKTILCSQCFNVNYLMIIIEYIMVAELKLFLKDTLVLTEIKISRGSQLGRYLVTINSGYESQSWWHSFVSPVLERLRQEDL